jgi:hypothetical protein
MQRVRAGIHAVNPETIILAEGTDLKGLLDRHCRVS